jgi:hypothetical protein
MQVWRLAVGGLERGGKGRKGDRFLNGNAATEPDYTPGTCPLAGGICLLTGHSLDTLKLRLGIGRCWGTNTFQNL